MGTEKCILRFIGKCLEKTTLERLKPRLNDIMKIDFGEVKYESVDSFKVSKFMVNSWGCVNTVMNHPIPQKQEILNSSRESLDH
jgi:hypothetical protein